MSIGAAASKPTRPLMPMMVSPHIPADAVRSGDGLNLLNGSHFVSEPLAVDSNDLTFLELDLDGLGAILCDLLQIRLLRKSLGGVQDLASTDGSAPKADIVGIFKFLEKE